ncbi:MAG: hypothetical protein RL268_70 [Pseudomonadota bacterium]
MAHANTPGSNALTFQSTSLDVVMRDGQPWLRGAQIALALGYQNPANAIKDLYNRNQDEFTDRMTTVVKLDTAGGAQDTRIFSLRGAHLLAMFARTAKAAEFRRWVLDVLDHEVEQPAALKATPAPETRLALTGAAQLGAEVQAEALAQLAHDEWLEGSRWLLSFVNDEYSPGEYRPHVKRVESGTFITTWRRLVDNISDPAMMLNADELGLMARACLAELERRAAYARQLEMAAHRAKTAPSAKPSPLPQQPRLA